MTRRSLMMAPRQPRHMGQFLVMFKDRDDAGQAARGELYAADKHDAVVDVGALKRWIGDHGLDEEVWHIAEPTAFGVVGIVATPGLAEQIRALPNIEAVIAD